VNISRVIKNKEEAKNTVQRLFLVATAQTPRSKEALGVKKGSENHAY